MCVCVCACVCASVCASVCVCVCVTTRALMCVSVCVFGPVFERWIHPVWYQQRDRVALVQNDVHPCRRQWSETKTLQ
jgi:hypothetical protein